MTEERDQRLFRELHGIREELRALREDFEKQGLREELDRQISEIEVEQRLYEIEHEIIEQSQPKKKKGRFRR